MKKIKTLIVFGTRPESIKLAPVIFEARKRSHIFEPLVVVTGQHREMLDQILQYFEIRPDADLNVMKNDQSLAGLTSVILQGLDGVIKKARPDLVVVQGDTTTTFAASLAAFYHRIPVAHVEAGMRTFDKYAPFPEEVNRSLTTTLASFHFAATESNRKNLLAHGIHSVAIQVTGNTVIDALFWSLEKNRRCAVRLPPPFPTSRRVILVTAHRRESFGQPLREICLALKDLMTSREDLELVFPVHMNPNVREVVHAVLGNLAHVNLIEPLSYDLFVEMMSRAFILLTDSGGIQEEAPSLGKPVLVMRRVTERMEAVDAGTVRLVGAERQTILSEALRLLDDRKAYDDMSGRTNPYGDGKAAERIVNFLAGHFCS